MALARKTSSVSGLESAIVALRGRLGYGQIALAKALGVDQSTVGKWETGQRPVPVRGLVKFAEIAPEDEKAFWLKKAGLNHESKEKMDRGIMRIPLVIGGAGAGPARLQDDDRVEEYLGLPMKYCPHPGDTKCIAIDGDSMEPTISNGTIVAVDRSERRVDRLRDKIVAAWREHEGVVIKRLVHIEGRDKLASDKPGYAPLELADGWEIVGRVAWWIQLA